MFSKMDLITLPFLTLTLTALLVGASFGPTTLDPPPPMPTGWTGPPVPTTSYEGDYLASSPVPTTSSMGDYLAIDTAPPHYYDRDTDTSNTTAGNATTNSATTSVQTTRPPRCGGLLQGSSGIISSPNYPRNYGNSELCVWKIVVEAGNTILLTFDHVDIEQASNCHFDSLAVRDGDKATSKLIGKYCGSSINQIKSSGNELYLRFSTDSSVTKKGFKASYISVPGCPIGYKSGDPIMTPPNKCMDCYCDDNGGSVCYSCDSVGLDAPNKQEDLSKGFPLCCAWSDVPFWVKTRQLYAGLN